VLISDGNCKVVIVALMVLVIVSNTAGSDNGSSDIRELAMVVEMVALIMV